MPEFLTKKEFSYEMQWSERTVRRLLLNGTIKGLRQPRARGSDPTTFTPWRIPYSELLRLKRGGVTNACEAKPSPVFDLNIVDTPTIDPITLQPIE